MRAGRSRDGEAGFTLAELLVVTAIVGLVLGGLMSLLISGQQSYMRGTNQVEAQQAARIAIARMAQEIREAGYNPRAVTTFNAFQTATATSFSINNDWNGNGVIDTGSTVTDPVKGQARGERVTYTVTGVTLTRQESAIDGSPRVILAGVQSMTFSYRDLSDAVTATPASIRSIVITTTVGEQSGTAQVQHASVPMQVRIRVRNQ